MFWGFGLEAIFIIGLASFRLTRLIVFDKITEFFRSPFYDEIMEDGEVYLVPKPQGLRKWIGELLNCYWCTGIWVSLFLVIGYWFIPTISIPVIFVLAIAGVGSILETMVSKWLGD